MGQSDEDVEASVAVLVVGHGRFPAALTWSSRLLIGEFKNVEALPLHEADSAEAFRDRLAEWMTKNPYPHGYLVLADLRGGTPAKEAVRLAMTRHDLSIVAGVNLPMLIEAITQSQTDMSRSELARAVASQGAEGVYEYVLPDAGPNGVASDAPDQAAPSSEGRLREYRATPRR